MDYEFVEIGTSDFNTLIEEAGSYTTGISVEPVSTYLDELPDLPGVKKVLAAISDRSYRGEVWWLPPERIMELGLMADYRGCNSLGKPHPTVLADLERRGLGRNEFRIDEIEVLSFADLVLRCQISSIRYLKIDTEGHDCTILKSMLDLGFVLPRKIRFEANSLSDMNEVNRTVERMRSHGYQVIYKTRTDLTLELH